MNFGVTVTGIIPTTQVDLPVMLDKVIANLRAAGWVVFYKGIKYNTFGSAAAMAGFAYPQIEFRLSRRGFYDEETAGEALKLAIERAMVGYSFPAKAAEEFVDHVVKPSLPPAATGAGMFGLALLGIYLTGSWLSGRGR